jgi:hypothetical protein
VTRTTFKKLNSDWNAEPNAPDPRVRVADRTLYLTFVLNSFQFPFEEGSVGELVFHNCWRYRLGPTNDEGWYSAQCRFSQLAPAWGEFYEVEGDLLLGHQLSWTSLGPPSPSSRHFLFYLRDETFECDADDWSFTLARGQ